MSHMKRNIDYLLDRRLIWIRKPINDKPDIDNEYYMFYEEGTYECYELFRSKAKITTYKSLKWHLLVLWYLNPQLDQDEFMELAKVIADKLQGFIAFAIHAELLRKIVYDVSMYDLNQPPKNKLRKVIFKPAIPGKPDLSKEDKLRIVSDKVSSIYLDGLTIDFSDDLIEPGFRLTNANAKGSCGCGSSFSTGDPAPNVDTGFSV